MNCLTPEQIAQLALGLAEDQSLAAHVDKCDACRVALAAARRVDAQLSAAHAAAERSHDQSRDRLLASLSREARPVQRMSARQRLPFGLGRLTTGQRIAVGGVGLSTAALLLLMLLLANSAGELSAMERIVNAARRVTSFSFRLSARMTVPPEDRRPWVVREQNDITYWQAPKDPNSKWLGNLSAETKARKFYRTESGDLGQGELSLHVKEVHPCGKRGILIIYTSRNAPKTYFRTHPVLANDIRACSPIGWLRAVRDRAGEIVRDLGTREIEGRTAHGYVMTFKDSASFRGFGPVEVWVDPQTDLPIEYSFEREEWDKEDVGFTEEFRVTECRWNIELDPKLFDTTPPAGFIDTTPPETDADIAKVVDALQLYAKLSGGHYPQVTTFDAKAIEDEMRQMAGFTGPPRPEWSQDETYQQIEQAAVGLDWLERVLLDEIRVRYFGQEVGPDDKDQVLLWWTVAGERSYRIFDGDLRTKIVTRDELTDLVPGAPY